MKEKIPIDEYGDGNCCPKCGSTKETRHEQRNIHVNINVQSGRQFILKCGKIKPLSMKDKADAFDSADSSGGGGCWSFECRKCGWKSETFTE